MMNRYTFDKLSLAIAVSKDELNALLSGKQSAILKNMRTPFKPGLKCYLYETKANGGRGTFVAIGTLYKSTHLFGLQSINEKTEQAIIECGLTVEEAKEKLSFRDGGIVFHLSDVEEVDNPDELTETIRKQFLIDPPKTVTQLKL